MKKKWIFPTIAIVLMILFVFIPLPPADLFLRLKLDEALPVDVNTFYLYYGTDDRGFDGDRLIQGSYDADKKTITYRIDSALAGHLTGLRIDFPGVEQSVGIRDVTISSAGVVKKRYNPVFFFSDSNRKAENGLTAVNLIPSRAQAYFGTTPDDPYVILEDPLCLEIAGLFSHYRMTRVLLCLFLIVCFASFQKKLFKE